MFGVYFCAVIFLAAFKGTPRTNSRLDFSLDLFKLPENSKYA